MARTLPPLSVRDTSPVTLLLKFTRMDPWVEFVPKFWAMPLLPTAMTVPAVMVAVPCLVQGASALPVEYT